jgi:hypothetical protein
VARDQARVERAIECTVGRIGSPGGVIEVMDGVDAAATLAVT